MPRGRGPRGPRSEQRREAEDARRSDRIIRRLVEEERERQLREKLANVERLALREQFAKVAPLLTEGNDAAFERMRRDRAHTDQLRLQEEARILQARQDQLRANREHEDRLKAQQDAHRLQREALERQDAIARARHGLR